jgi:hypothetical protein
MTTTDQPPTHEPAADDLGSFVDFLRAAGAAMDPDNPQPLLQGAFAIYPTAEGGVVCVANIDGDGPMAGVRHIPIRPGMIRALAAFAGGGARMANARTIFGRRRKADG